MKSVHLTNYYHKNSGGISTSYNNLLAAAERHKRYIRLIVPGETESVEDVNEFAKIYYVPARYSPIFDKRYRIMMPWQYMRPGSIIRNILLAEMPDMVEVTDKYTLSLIGPMIGTNSFKRLGRPMLVHFSCERMDDNVGSFLSGGRLARWFSRRVISNYTFPNYDFHIANSAYTAEEFYESVRKDKNPRRSTWFLNKCWRFFAAARVPFRERIYVCPRGVDSSIFYPERRSSETEREMRERAGIPDDAIA
jgi:glycosyltransferase involved in cell wall biosynthesis